MDIKVERLVSFYLGTQHSFTGRDSGMEENGKRACWAGTLLPWKKGSGIQGKGDDQGAIVLRDDHWAWGMKSLTVSFSTGEGDGLPQEWQDASGGNGGISSF